MPGSSALVLRIAAGLLSQLKVPVAGRLFVFDTHVCWLSLAHSLSEAVAFEEVTSVEKVRSLCLMAGTFCPIMTPMPREHLQARGLFGTVPTRVQLVRTPTGSSRKETVTFVSLTQREKIFQAVSNAWVKVPPRLRLSFAT